MCADTGSCTHLFFMLLLLLSEQLIPATRPQQLDWSSMARTMSPTSTQIHQVAKVAIKWTCAAPTLHRSYPYLSWHLTSISFCVKPSAASLLQNSAFTLNFLLLRVVEEPPLLSRDCQPCSSWRPYWISPSYC